MAIPSVEDIAEFLGELVVTGGGNVFGYRHGGSCDVARYAGHGVGIATQGDGTDGSIHEAVGFEETDDGFGYALVACSLELIIRTYIVGGAMEVVTEGMLDVRLDVGLRLTGPVEEDGSCYGLGSTDAFFGVVRDFGCGLCQTRHSSSDSAYQATGATLMALPLV